MSTQFTVGDKIRWDRGKDIIEGEIIKKDKMNIRIKVINHPNPKFNGKTPWIIDFKGKIEKLCNLKEIESEIQEKNHRLK